ncbi:MAG TPA: TatD family hydrolase [Longimicrobiales bacterium]|nr:TatD family hydrolase [Longimicrobiales bacterium]
MTTLFDSHCHLTAPAFDGDRSDVLRRAREAGVAGLVTIASTPEDAEAGLALARTHDGVWTTAGIHPHEAEAGTPAALARVRDLLDREGVVAVGECGLDFHYDNAPRAVQRRVFRAHVELAAETGLPLVIHARSCDDDMVAAVRDFPPEVKGVLHCFSGSDLLLETGLETGLYISVTGIVTFRSFEAEHQIRTVPRDRLMIETDAPYLAPVPKRGRRNEPAFVRHVAEAVARIRGESTEAVAAFTMANARRFYGMD